MKALALWSVVLAIAALAIYGSLMDDGSAPPCDLPIQMGACK